MIVVGWIIAQMSLWSGLVLAFGVLVLEMAFAFRCRKICNNLITTETKLVGFDTQQHETASSLVAILGKIHIDPNDFR